MERCAACTIPFHTTENPPVVIEDIGPLCEDCAFEWQKALRAYERKKEAERDSLQAV